MTLEHIQAVDGVVLMTSATMTSFNSQKDAEMTENVGDGLSRSVRTARTRLRRKTLPSETARVTLRSFKRLPGGSTGNMIVAAERLIPEEIPHSSAENSASAETIDFCSSHS
jgi:hypothetical protein